MVLDYCDRASRCSPRVDGDVVRADALLDDILRTHLVFYPRLQRQRRCELSSVCSRRPAYSPGLPSIHYKQLETPPAT